MSLKNLIEHEKWAFAHKDEASCPTTYDVQRYRDVREHNASIDYIQGAAEKMFGKYCIWRQEKRDVYGDGTYSTECGEMFSFTDGTSTENKAKYCPFCGRLIDEVPEEMEHE